jgi:hypothetical protein
MRHNNERAAIATKRIERAFPYDNQTVLHMSVGYPKVQLSSNRLAQGRINGIIHSQVDRFVRRAEHDLFGDAVEDYRQARHNGYPFHSHEAVLNYTIAFNMNCHLSLYRDLYTYAGGAHGSTLRASDTFDLNTGARLPLSSYFGSYRFFRQLLIEKITAQADENMKGEPGIYFNDYAALIRRNFDERSYYLTPRGLTVYYQQYEIGPYATGIVVFTIPYRELHFMPSCTTAGQN